MIDIESSPLKELTIVKSKFMRLSLRDGCHPRTHFLRVKDTALQCLLSACKEGDDPDFRVCLLFDCMLRILNEPVINSALFFCTHRFSGLQRKFYGALGSDRFVSASKATRDDWAYRFNQIILRLSRNTDVMILDHQQRVSTKIPAEFVADFEGCTFDREQIALLQPYLLISKSGIEYNVLLTPMLRTLGHEFTNTFHNGLIRIARQKAKDAALRDFGSTFSRFIQSKKDSGQSIRAEYLMDREFMQSLVVDFMEYHFMKMTRRDKPVQEGTLSSLQKLWSRYRIYWQNLALQGVWAEPLYAFPEGNPKLMTKDTIAHRKIIENDDGTSSVITSKLIRQVPLYVTDEEATNLLFVQLKRDFATVQAWLTQHLDKFFNDRKQGELLASDTANLPCDSELRRVFSTKSKVHESTELAVRYFKERFNGYTDTSRHETLVYPGLAARTGPSKHAVSKLLGLPLRCDAMAMMAFLASHDGRFSEAAMGACVLMDRNGRRINAVETDAGMSLSVLKARDQKDGWHDIVLREEAARYVRLWIEATSPIRDYMRSNNIPGWRNLFIYLSKPLGAPSSFTRSTNLYNSFRDFARSGENVLGDLADHITIPRIRSTRGVLVFMETMDLSAMARELGNSSDTSLRHYLPDSLWNYFSTRWIRIFQNLLIVESTQNTPYMQRALKFSSAEDMDLFLRNHALQSIMPQASTNDTATMGLNDCSELMVPASKELFSLLLSLSTAADKAIQSGKNVTAQATYWSEFTKRIRAHVLSADFHDRGVKLMMSEAEKSISDMDFMEVVCA